MALALGPDAKSGKSEAGLEKRHLRYVVGKLPGDPEGQGSPRALLASSEEVS